MMRFGSLLLSLTLLASCGRKTIDVHKDGEDFDFGRSDLLVAVDKAASNRTKASAIDELDARIRELRSQFNEPVEEEAERKLVFLAIGPLQTHFTEPFDQQMEVLGTTVWPIALQVEPVPGEAPRTYVERICANELALECKHVVPEYWSVVLSAVVWRRLKERAREAYVHCGPCKTEPGKSFEKILEAYRAHQTIVGAKSALAKKRGHPSQWPKPGDSAVPWDSAVPLLELLDDGSTEFRGQVVDAAWRRLIKERRDGAEVLGLHIRPIVSVRKLSSVLDDAGRAGYAYVDLQVRARDFPYQPKRYRLALRARRGTPAVRVKPVDSVQILVQAIEVAVKKSPPGSAVFVRGH